MRMTLVAAMSQNRVIGIDGQLPWHLPADLAHFKSLTLGKPILMGRLTYDSIGRPLPKRRNLVLTRSTEFRPSGVEVFHTLEDVLDSLDSEQELMVIGGGQIYAQTLARADRIQLTIVHSTLDGDAFFPLIARENWEITSREDHAADEKNALSYSFVQLDKSVGSSGLPTNFPDCFSDVS